MNEMAYLPVEQVKIPYRIFVGGIAFNTTKEELKEFFSRYGAVRDSKIIRDAEGLSKGYGFVTFFREEDAKKVMNMGTIFFKEKRLNISEAYRKQPALQATANQQANVYLPAAASSTWTTASPANAIYPSNQCKLKRRKKKGKDKDKVLSYSHVQIENKSQQLTSEAPQMTATVQLPPVGNWPNVQTAGAVHQVAWQPQPTETVYWIPAPYYYY